MTSALELLKQWAGNPPTITDDVFQSLLDRRSQRVRVPLIPDPAGLVFRSDFSGWLTATLTDEDGQPLTPASEDLAAGKWTFGAARTYVLADGVVCDIHGAAADAWTMRMAQANTWKGDFANGARQMIAYHQARAYATSVDVGRDDLGRRGY